MKILFKFASVSQVKTIENLWRFGQFDTIFYRLNWLALDNVAPLAIAPCVDFLGESCSILCKPPALIVEANFLADLGDSNVLNICPLL